MKQQKLCSSSHVQQEYLQSSNRRAYKVCNIYEIKNKTFEEFGFIINDPRSTWSTPRVWSHDRMSITTPKESIKEAVDKPFCCKFCGSENYIKYGKKSGKQFYKCKDCNRGFVDNLYFEGMKGSPKIICVTLDLYFKGVSLRDIADHLKQCHDLKVHFTTLYHWIKRYIEILDNYVSQFEPKLGNVWHADEMMVNIKGDWFYLWNVMDEFTRFHLASVVSKERKIMDARRAFQKAKKTSHNGKPRCIVTDGLQSYHKAINKEFGTARRETIHIPNVGVRGKQKKTMVAKFDNNLIERLQGTVRDRNKTQRGLKSENTTFVKGHQLYYNFIRSHDSLNGYTPAHFANIYLNLGDKKWEKLLSQSMK